MAFANMLQQSAWWDGSAISLLTESHPGLFGPIPIGSWFGQLLGSGLLGSALGAGILLFNPRTVSLGILVSLVYGTLTSLLTGDWLFVLISLAFSLAFLPNVEPSKKE